MVILSSRSITRVAWRTILKKLVKWAFTEDDIPKYLILLSELKLITGLIRMPFSLLIYEGMRIKSMKSYSYTIYFIYTILIFTLGQILSTMRANNLYLWFYTIPDLMVPGTHSTSQQPWLWYVDWRWRTWKKLYESFHILHIAGNLSHVIKYLTQVCFFCLSRFRHRHVWYQHNTNIKMALVNAGGRIILCNCDQVYLRLRLYSVADVTIKPNMATWLISYMIDFFKIRGNVFWTWVHRNKCRQLQ